MANEITRLVMEYLPVIIAAAAPVVMDAVAGALPDRWVPYVGGVRRIVRKAIALYRKRAGNQQ